MAILPDRVDERSEAYRANRAALLSLLEQHEAALAHDLGLQVAGRPPARVRDPAEGGAVGIRRVRAHSHAACCSGAHRPRHDRSTARMRTRGGVGARHNAEQGIVVGAFLA